MTHVLHIRLLSYWRAGSGMGMPGALDATCKRDDDGLPMIPGKHLKGLLRDTVRLAHKFEWHSTHEAELFGPRGPEETGSASLRISSAHLPGTERSILAKNEALKAALFTTKRSTAIEAETGTARPASLRFEEIAVPMNLVAEVVPLQGAPDRWDEVLAISLPLLRGIGAGRTRGLGRAKVTLAR